MEWDDNTRKEQAALLRWLADDDLAHYAEGIAAEDE